VDVVKECFPIWGFASNARVQGDSVLILKQLLAALQTKATPASREAAAKRVEAMRSEGNERRAASRSRPGQREERRDQPALPCAEISKAIGDDAIVVNEGIRNGPSSTTRSCAPGPAPRSFRGRRPGQLIGNGARHQARSARSDRAADGRRRRLLFRQPVSVYAVSKQYKLPILTVLFDNSGWSAVKEATLRVYPEGDAKATNEFNALLAPDIEFTKICEAAGGYGERWTIPKRCPRRSSAA